jgi:membrane-associated phospholipid phosphatase
VAPPRLLPGAGFADVVADSGTWGAWQGGVAERANEFASMPSVHLAWAVWVALTVASMTSRRWVRAAAWVHVALTSVVVVVTGNHYVLDLVAGTVVAAAAWWCAPRLLPGRRRDLADQPLEAAEPVEAVVD